MRSFVCNMALTKARRQSLQYIFWVWWVLEFCNTVTFSLGIKLGQVIGEMEIQLLEGVMMSVL